MIQESFMRSCCKGLLFISVLSLSFAFCSAAKQDMKKAEEKPKVVHVGPVTADLVGITVQSGQVEYGEQVPYTTKNEGKLSPDNAGNMWIRQWGKITGALVSGGTKIMTLDRIVGEKLNTETIDKTENFTIKSADDPDYARESSPVAVYRKSKPTDLARITTGVDAPIEHTIYLKLQNPLKVGKKYTIVHKPSGFLEQSFVYDPVSMRSEAVHVSHIGFRPDDPSKIAFLSLWMGSGGPMDFKEKKQFFVLNDKTGESVFKGDVRLSKSLRDKNEDAYDRNYNGTDVYIMDFSSLNMPGIYRVYVEGIGCSYPFEIAMDVWGKAFYVSARGLYHQRSGIEIGPPYSTFKRPRNFHPDDGLKVYASRLRLMDTPTGFAESGDTFAMLAAGRTSEIVPGAWGGYCDAADWDRRIQHLDIARLMLELVDLFPSFFEKLSLGIPKSTGDLPDLMNEALWGVDFYKRLQRPEGGIRGGIESEGHPRYGEASWQESWAVMAYAPDIWCSYLYAGVAARAAYTLKTSSQALSNQYLESALRAMEWAEKEWKTKPASTHQYPVNDARNLAAAELFRQTGKKEWHDIFLQTTAFKSSDATLYRHKSHNQGDAAWVYYTTEKAGMDASVKRNCRNAIIFDADMRILKQPRAGFRWSKDPYRPAHTGAFTIPDCISVVRAHVITGKKEYLQAVILASQTGAGANPLNMCYTTGMGYKYPQHIMHLDARVTRQLPPPGLTVFGPLDATQGGHEQAGQFCYPPPKEWPVIETYWDVFWDPGMCEFTVHQTMAPNAYVWGYLAARK